MAFRETLSDIPLPQQVANTVPSSASILAEAIAPAAGIFETAVQNVKKSQFVGTEDVELQDLPGLQELDLSKGINRQDAASQLQVDALSSLNQIKLARQQGLISATRARLQTNKVIREVSSGNPGMEQILRGKAGEFFGQFGPGDLLLQETNSESFEQEAYQAMIKEGVKHGIINPINPLSDTKGILSWQKMQSQLAVAEHTKNLMEANIKTGEVSVESYSQAYNQSRVEPVIAGTINDIRQMLDSGQRIADPQEIVARLKVTEQQLISDLTSKLNQIPGAPVSAVKAQIDNIKSRFTDLNELAKSGTLVEFINQRSDLIESMAKNNMLKRFPMMVGMEKAFPNLGRDILAYGDKWSNMPAAQRDGFAKTIQNPFLREAFVGMVDSGDHFSMAPVVERALSANVIPTDAFTKTYVDSFALESARGGNPLDEPANSSSNASINYVLKNVDEKGTLSYLATEPKVIARIRQDKAKQQALKNRILSADVNVSSQMVQSLSDTTFFPETEDQPVGQLVYDEVQQQFKINFTEAFKEREQRAIYVSAKEGGTGFTPVESFSRFVPGFVNDLNEMNAAINTYSTELNMPIEKWRAEIIRKYNNTINLIQDSRAKEQEVDGLTQEVNPQ